MTNMQDIFDAIVGGVADKHFSDIYEAIKARKDVVAKREALSFTEGTLVRTKAIRPKYLAGLECQIVRKVGGNSTRFEIAILDPLELASAGKYTNAKGNLEVLPICLELIETS